MTLEERLDADLKDAMRSGDTVRKLAIRAAKTAITETKVAGTFTSSATAPSSFILDLDTWNAHGGTASGPAKPVPRP